MNNSKFLAECLSYLTRIKHANRVVLLMCVTDILKHTSKVYIRTAITVQFTVIFTDDTKTYEPAVKLLCCVQWKAIRLPSVGGARSPEFKLILGAPETA